MTSTEAECPVVVEIEGITPPAQFARLGDALAALWESMRLLPLGEPQADWFGYYLTRPDAARRVAEMLERDQQVELSFGLPDGPHVLCVRKAGVEVPQRCSARRPSASA
ncbi:hypothetical protein OG455_31305 [Kitasatospora sp. NBC_01287]|uniref:hypothetical protein n=1 Tax=Kitasatospora sp. NBC_01287 TaxID=2903573 RepID=UPI00224FA830|nr:hypothetical protein [Kitasatospora sp. NBC_01287]MCX4749954.1 hypothetical protein [Kitasatospora sp. NBC_01287]